MKSTKEIPFNKYGISTYHIDFESRDNTIYQRHVWTYEAKEIEVQAWIVFHGDIKKLKEELGTTEL